jgi:hypothetical protein
VERGDLGLAGDTLMPEKHSHQAGLSSSSERPAHHELSARRTRIPASSVRIKASHMPLHLILLASTVLASETAEGHGQSILENGQFRFAVNS